jgi:protein TonB
VVLRLHIDSDGQVAKVEVVTSAGYGFDRAAVAAVKRSRFQPASRNGRPVACLALLPVEFKLRRGEE